MNQEIELSEVGMATRAFALWSDYWLTQGTQVPPLHLSKYTMDGGVLFFAPMGRPEVQLAIDEIAKRSELFFLMEGESMIKEHTWFGHWCGFSVKAKPLAKIQVHPTPRPRRPERWFY